MTTVQLRRYELLDDMMNAFVAWWPGVIEVRAKYGFKVQFALADRDTNQFTWARTMRWRARYRRARCPPGRCPSQSLTLWWHAT